MAARLKTKDDAAYAAFVREHCPAKRLGAGGEHEDEETCPGCRGLSRTLLAFMQALAPAENGDPPHTAANVMLEAFAGTGCLGRSAPDEPVFTLVARDKLAADVVAMWASDAITFGGLPPDSPKVTGAWQVAEDMKAWRAAHGGGKVPD
jgi:hypothetical protein